MSNSSTHTNTHAHVLQTVDSYASRDVVYWEWKVMHICMHAQCTMCSAHSECVAYLLVDEILSKMRLVKENKNAKVQNTRNQSGVEHSSFFSLANGNRHIWMRSVYKMHIKRRGTLVCLTILCMHFIQCRIHYNWNLHALTSIRGIFISPETPSG